MTAVQVRFLFLIVVGTPLLIVTMLAEMLVAGIGAIAATGAQGFRQLRKEWRIAGSR